MIYQVRIKELPADLRPRERLERLGAEALSDMEILAIILATGSKNESALDLAHRIISENQGLKSLAEMSFSQLIKIRGIGKAKANQIKAALELGKRVYNSEPEEKISIKSPEIVASIIADDLKFLDKEHFKILLLNTKNHLISIETISIGSLNSCIVHPREVFKMAISKSAASIILAHNHPSGDTTPSKEDIDITAKLKEAGQYIGIEVLDHLIIGGNSYLSFREKGII